MKFTRWIGSADELEALDRWKAADWIGVDTEFIRERTFHPELALIQLGRGEDIVLLDAPALPQAPALLELLSGPAVKVMHAAGEDLQALQHHYGVLPRPLFDTQIAAAMSGFDAGMSYQRLIETVCGLRLEKGETRSNWLQRPLSDAQLHYAADDVRYLERPYRELDARLRELGRREWLDQEGERMLAAAAVAETDPHPQLALRPAQMLDAAAQALLRRLLLWRDREARSSNRPRNWILDAALATELAQRPPADAVALDLVLDRNSRSPRRRRDELLELLSAPLSTEERDIPLARSLDGPQRNRLKQLQAGVATVALQLQIPEGLLAARKHLERLLLDREWPQALDGWRRPLLEPVLSPLLD